MRGIRAYTSQCLYLRLLVGRLVGFLGGDYGRLVFPGFGFGVWCYRSIDLIALQLVRGVMPTAADAIE